MYEIIYVNTITQSLKGKVKYKLDKMLFVETDNDETLVIPHQTINMGTQKDKILNSTGLIGATLDTDCVVKCVACITAISMSIDRNNDRLTATLVGGKSININFMDLIKISEYESGETSGNPDALLISPKGQVKLTRGKPCRREDVDEEAIPKKKDVSFADAVRVFPSPDEDGEEDEDED